MILRRFIRDRKPRPVLPVGLTACLLALGVPLAHAQSTTLFFEGEGPEEGITVPGACCFSFGGAEFFGFEGVVAPVNSALTASGEFAYRVAGSDIGLCVIFTEPVDFVSFFFVHDPDELALIGSAELRGTDGAPLATFESSSFTTPGDPANFVFAEPGEPIQSIMILGLAAYVDDFAFGMNPAAASGAVPDGDDVPGPPLVLSKAAGADITLSWTASCLASDADYAVYAGQLSDFASHVPVGNPVCSTSNTTTVTITPVIGGRYYLVVPQSNLHEGSYGTQSSGTPRPPSLSACKTQFVGACP